MNKDTAPIKLLLCKPIKTDGEVLVNTQVAPIGGVVHKERR